MNDAYSWLGDPRGPLHSGPGNQINFFLSVVGAAMSRSTARSPYLLDEESVRWLRRRFVEPGGYGEAFFAIETARTVVLEGRRGSGRYTTAAMLLRAVGNGLSQIRLLSADAESDDEPVLDPSNIEQGDRLLLDLSTADEVAGKAILGRLAAYCGEVRRRGAYLVAVLPPGVGAEGELHGLVVKITPPRPRDALVRHLRADDTAYDDADLDAPRLSRFLAQTSMEDVARLARYIKEGEASRPADGFATWLDEALSGVTDRTNEIATNVRNLDGNGRALLFTAAMCSGAAADTVFDATASLLEIVGFPRDDAHLLDRSDLAERFERIGALTDQDRKVQFGKLAYDSAACDYFWDNYPELRSYLRQWLDKLIRHRALTADDRERIVDRFASQFLRTDRHPDIDGLVPTWAEGPSTLPFAARLLERALEDPRHGSRYRRLVYDWSRSTGTSPPLAGLLVAVCSQGMAKTHPAQAIVRLHYLARRSDRVGELAAAALIDLVGRDRRLFRRLLDRIAYASAERRSVGDVPIFLELVKPERLLSDGSPGRPLLAERFVRDRLVIGWCAVMLSVPCPEWVARVRSWLGAFIVDPRGAALLDVLVEAAGSCGGADLARLYVIARDWAQLGTGLRPARDAVVEVLLRKIDSAQGISKEAAR